MRLMEHLFHSWCYSSFMSEKSIRKTMSLPAEIALVSKKNCIERAEKILRNGEITDMSVTGLAAELYFHACMSKISDPFAKRHIPFFTWLKKHADPIDLVSGGDTLFRKIIFRLYWYLPEIH